MRTVIITFFLLFASQTAFMQTQPLRYLALGDSYTIGESVQPTQNFPHQTVALLRKQKIKIDEPTIIATTGWTTDELQDALSKVRLATPFDFVTLLIGVNNQYRGRSLENYAAEFTQLLQQAIDYAGGRKERVIVLSIPDWGITPFAEGRDRQKIAAEIDAFNAVNEHIAKQYEVHYLNITSFTREGATNLSLIAEDGLHPSAADYKRWAAKLAHKMSDILKAGR